MKTRNQIADELMVGCPDESKHDHEIIADAIRSGKPINKILAMPETNNWPETHVWINLEMADLPETEE